MRLDQTLGSIETWWQTCLGCRPRSRGIHSTEHHTPPKAFDHSKSTRRQDFYQVAKDGSKVCPLDGVDAHDLLVGRPDQACSVHLETDILVKMCHQA